MADPNYISQITLPNNSQYLIKAASVPLAGVTGADDLKAIEALSGTSGLLKKTAANTWTLDTTSYTTNTGTVTSITPGNGLIKGTSGTSQAAITTTGTISIKEGGVTNAMLAGSIDNSKLANSSISIAGSNVSLGSSISAETLRTNLGLSTAMHFRGIATVAYSDNTFPAISGYTTKEAGDVVIDKDSKYEYVWTGSAWELLGGDESYKTKQTAVSDPTAGNSGQINFINTISQDANGVITATKQPVRVATTSQTGVIQITKDNANSFLNQLDTGSSTPVDNDYYISQYVSGGTTTTTYHRRPMSALYAYVKGKTDTVYKPKQTAVESVTAETTTATTFVHSVTQDTNGVITVKTRPLPTYNNYSLPVAKYNTLGGLKPAYTSTNAATLTTSAATNTNTPTIAAKTTNADRYYAVEADKNGVAYVNVPWTFTNTTYTLTSGDANGQIKVTPSSGDAYNVDVTGLGTAAYTAATAYATSGHTHTTNIATDTGTSAITLAYGEKYKLTAGGTSKIFTMPSMPTAAQVGAVATSAGVTAVTWDDTNKKLTRTINGTAADVVTFAAGTNIGITSSSGTVTIANTYSLPLAASGTRGGIQIGYTTTGNNYAVQLSSEKAYVNVPWTDTKVTTVGNHYAPSADSNAELTAAISGTAGAYAKDATYTVITGIKAQRDAKGHVTGITYTAQNIKDTNTTYTFTNKAASLSWGATTTIATVGGTDITVGLPANPNTDTKVNVTLGTTSTAYLLGVTTTPTSTAQALTAISDTGVYLGTTAGELVAAKFTGALNGTANVANKLGTADKGSTTKPIYLAAGVATECSTYAGGTAVTLNGTSKAASTASFYAPTSAGNNTQALVGGTPSWTNISPSITIGAGTSAAAPTVNVSVLGQSGTAQSITTATTGVYGVTKLQDGVSSNSTTLAATANAAKTASTSATHTLATTTKFFVTGCTSSTTNTAGDDFDTGVYVTTSAGELSAGRYSYNLAGASEKAYSYYNPNDLSIDFVFN